MFNLDNVLFIVIVCAGIYVLCLSNVVFLFLYINCSYGIEVISSM